MTCHCTLSLLSLAPLYCTISLNCAPTLLQSLCCQGYSCAGSIPTLDVTKNWSLSLSVVESAFSFWVGLVHPGGGWGCSQRENLHVAPVGSRDRCSFPSRWCNSLCALTSFSVGLVSNTVIWSHENCIFVFILCRSMSNGRSPRWSFLLGSGQQTCQRIYWIFRVVGPRPR